jgi:hypothetical protein
MIKRNPSQATVEQIKAGRIIKRLQEFIFDTTGDALMTSSQVTAALGLLKKVHPDLAAAQVEVTEPIRVIVGYVGSHVAMDKAS